MLRSLAPFVRPRPASAKIASFAKNRAFSSANISANQELALYSGGFDKALRILKRVSIFSCVCTVFGVPLLAITSTNPRTTPVQRGLVAFVVVIFGVGTSVALHIVVKPYVTRIFMNSDKSMSIETMNIFGGLKVAPFEMSKIRPAQQAWASFESGPLISPLSPDVSPSFSIDLAFPCVFRALFPVHLFWPIHVF